MAKPVILIQGGAGSYEKIQQLKSTDVIHSGIKAAAAVGYRKLVDGCSAVDAVEAAVASMEDNEYFNAGKGSHLTVTGKVEMDASIMDGSSLLAGGVTCVNNVRNPVKLARLVMDKSKSVLLTGEGADQFARKHLDESAFAAKEYFVTDHAMRRLNDYLKESKSGSEPFDKTMTDVQAKYPKDTVGAVALDQHGNLAYATSTGGTVAKELGRIGDSPIVGCGGYADNTVGAISTTGVGEAIIKVSLAKHIHILMEQGMNAQDASKAAVDYMHKRVGTYVGVVTLSKDGDVGIHFNSQGMAWALVKDNCLSWGITQGERHTQDFV